MRNMRRYIFDRRLLDTELSASAQSDVVVVGGGMAGLYAALSVDKRYSVTLVIKGDLSGGSSYLAQGGICCVISDSDSFESHISDTLRAGAGHCDEQAVRVMVTEGPENIKKLIELGVPFDRDNDGGIRITREGGHTHRRILHCGGDATGRLVTETLGKHAQERDNIRILWGCDLVDILADADGVYGVVIRDSHGESVIRSSNVVVATGGAGQLYKYSTTPVGNTGEGIAACLRAGAKARDMEFVQFHPTAFAIHGEGERVFLISEAVRGEGALLCNEKGEYFMKDPGQHPLADLAPRDIVTRAILRENEKNGTDRVYLDTSAMSREFFEKRFPTITKKCHENGIFPPDDRIPVHPAQHYLMGGIETDLFARTCVEGLYVCGEAACTGVHGANRLASNSTLECLVFARRAAECINRAMRPCREDIHIEMPIYDTDAADEKKIESDMHLIKEIMTTQVGAVRRSFELSEAKERLERLLSEYENKNFVTPGGYALISAIVTALEIVNAAIARKESIGSHYIIE